MPASTPRLQQHDTAALFVLLMDSLERGHWRVACRRYLKLLACGSGAPTQTRDLCDRLLQRCSTRERQKMQADADAWAGMSRATARPAPVRHAAPTVANMPEAVLPASRTNDRQEPVQSAFRTQWRPYPRLFVTAKSRD